MEGDNPISNENKEGEKGEEEKTTVGNDDGRDNNDDLDIIVEGMYDSSMENANEITNEDSEDQGEENQNDSKLTEQPNEDYIITRTLSRNGKETLFTRYILSLYYNNEGKLDHEYQEINDEYLTDQRSIGSTTFKLIIIYKMEDNNVNILELFFDIQVNHEFSEVVEKITKALIKLCENFQPLFFIFSPSIYTLDCYLGVLKCMDKLPDTYFIAMSSPLSGRIDEEDEKINEKVKKILDYYKLNEKDKYIELLDLEVEKSYSNNRTNFFKPIVVQIHLPNVDILLSKHIHSLNKDILREIEMKLEDWNGTLTNYYYVFARVADAVNKNFSNDTPEIPMTRRSFANLIKSLFFDKHYLLTFKPETDQDIHALQSSLKDGVEMSMKKGDSITISTANIKLDGKEDNAIKNLYNSLRSVLFIMDENSKIGQFFPDKSNPLILTSDYFISQGEDIGKSLKKFIEAYDNECKEMPDNDFFLSRRYSLYSDRQRMRRKMSHEIDGNLIASKGDAADSATGGAVPLKKKAIIISIILGAILIVVIVIVVIVTSRDEGFKPSMRQIKS